MIVFDTLWNEDELTSSLMNAWSVPEFLGRVSDQSKSRVIWYWEVK